jgi:DNA replication initiation complex subunit (GINS family)
MGRRRRPREPRRRPADLNATYAALRRASRSDAAALPVVATTTTTRGEQQLVKPPEQEAGERGKRPVADGGTVLSMLTQFTG